MVGHTFIYNAAVRYVKKLLDAGELGEIRYIYSQRLNLGRIRADIDALWNFAPHDISIIQYWLGDPAPVSVHRLGMDFIQKGVDDVVFLSLVYPQKIIANIHVSWLDPQKVRKMIVVGSRKMVVYDDIADAKIAIYDKGIDKKAILGQNMDFDNPRPEQFSYQKRRHSAAQHQLHGAIAVRSRAFCGLRQERKETDNRHAPCKERGFDPGTSSIFCEVPLCRQHPLNRPFERWASSM